MGAEAALSTAQTGDESERDDGVFGLVQGRDWGVGSGEKTGVAGQEEIMCRWKV